MQFYWATPIFRQDLLGVRSSELVHQQTCIALSFVIRLSGAAFLGWSNGPTFRHDNTKPEKCQNRFKDVQGTKKDTAGESLKLTLARPRPVPRPSIDLSC